MHATEAKPTNAPAGFWARIPSKGYCPHTGLSRAAYYRLIGAGKIKSASLKQPGQVRGTRLVYIPSVLQYIEQHAEGPEA